MKFIHAADLHLDTPFVSINNYSKDLQESLKKSTYSAALKVFQTAIEESVDFVILAGDTFDNTEHSLNTQMFLKEQFEELQKYDIQVYMVYGNHDYFRNSLAIIDFPSNVHIFDQNVSTMDLTTKDGQTVAITGFSYYQRHIADKMIQYFPERKSSDYQIGILHAGIGDDHYAPFKVNELIAKGYDYWALGHIHKREILNRHPWIVYPGDTQGRNQNETDEKGFYLVTVKDSQTQLDFVPSSVYIWKNAQIDIQDDETINTLIQKVSEKLQQSNTLVTLNLINAQRLSKDVVNLIVRGDLLHHFDSSENGRLYKIYLKYNRNKELEKIDQKYWDESQKNIFDLDKIKSLSSKLYNEEILRDHMNEAGFLKHIQESTKNIINKKYDGE